LDDRPKEIEVRIGEMEISKSPDILKALLGSCVAAILYDKVNKIGGLAHIFLPSKAMSRDGDNHPDSRFADSAIPSLLKSVIDAGAKKTNVVAYLVGGNNVLTTVKQGGKATIAEQNIDATVSAIQKENLFMINCGVGKDNGSKVRFNLSNGDIEVVDIKKQTK
jgi:chemotaxis protein CheD